MILAETGKAGAVVFGALALVRRVSAEVIRVLVTVGLEGVIAFRELLGIAAVVAEVL